MLTKKSAANVMVKVIIKRVRNELKKRYANVPSFVAELWIDTVGIESMLPPKAASIINNSDYTTEQVKALALQR